jgi:hypothetical protein
MSEQRITVRPPPLTSASAETNGNGHDHRHDDDPPPPMKTPLEIAANAALEAKQAALETHGMVGEMMREHADQTKKIDRVVVKVDRLSEKVDAMLLHSGAPHPAPEGLLHPPRAPLPSLHFDDLDQEETQNGTRVLRGTEDQLRAIAETQVRAILRQRDLERDAAPLIWVKGNLPKAALPIITAAIAAAGAALFALCKSLLARFWH